MAQKDNDLQKIQELIEIMKRNELVEIEIEHGDDKIHLKRSQPQSGQGRIAAGPTVGPEVSAAPPGAVAAEALSAEPQPLPSQPRSAVSPQTVVCIIEAMKVMNEIKAETSGMIAEILVTNGQAVEYGQVLFKVKPD